jgi:hypothetical protein
VVVCSSVAPSAVEGGAAPAADAQALGVNASGGEEHVHGKGQPGV